VGVLKILQKTQHLATISIIGALQSTPSDLLDAHVGVLLPMELMLWKSCHRALVRLLTLPKSHPLHKTIQKAKSSLPSKYLSPIDQLLKVFKLHRKTIETITLLTEICYNRFVTEISTSRKESIANKVKDTADFKVFSDSPRAISNTGNATDGKHLLFNLRIKWISGHSKIVGNEKADKLAKEAAEGKASWQVDLPPILQKELPISDTAIKQEQHAKLLRRWRQEWTTSPRCRRMERIDTTFPFNDFCKRHCKLTQGQASTLFQIRSGHFPLNAYLHRINRSETKYCQRCEPEEGAQEETVDHFLFKCKAHNVCRWNLAKTIEGQHLNLQD